MPPVFSYTDKLSGQVRNFNESDKEFIVTFKGKGGGIWEKIVDFFTSDYSDTKIALDEIRQDAKALNSREQLLTGVNEIRGFGRVCVNEYAVGGSNASTVEANLDALKQAHHIVNYARALVETHASGGENIMYYVPGTFALQLTKSYLEGPKPALSDTEKKFLEDHDLGDPLVESWTPGLFELKLPPNKTLYQTITEFSAMTDVYVCEPNFCGFNDQMIAPNEAYFTTDIWGVKKVKAFESGVANAWNHAKMGAGGSNGVSQVKIAVVDTGIKKNHNDLGTWDGLKSIESKPALEDWDFSDQLDKDPDDVSADGHGTNVAGVIGAASPNATGTVGVAPGCKIIPLRCDLGVTDGGTYRERADAINYIGSNVNWTDKWGTSRGQGLAFLNQNNRYIINLSWTMTGGSSLVQSAIASAVTRNVLVVCAAGNKSPSGVDIYASPYVYPARYSAATFPSCEPGVVAVAGSTNADGKTTTSNFGANVIYAPGENVYTTHNGGTASYTTTAGTSMAAAFVSGVAALIYTANYISNGGFNIGAAAVKDVLTAAGSLDALTGGAIGLGRINAKKCLDNGSV